MKVKILDTTLRDGEQTPGVSLTPEEKLRIAIKLDSIGVDIIEAGSAITSAGERDAIKKIASEGLSAEICSFARALKQDIDSAIECDVDSIHLVIPTSDIHIQYKMRKTKNEILEQAIESVEYALEHGLVVELSAEDATRSDFNFLKKIFTEGINAGAQRICACDTVGVLTPERAYDFYKKLSKLDVPLAAHCHNDFGLATANSLSAIRAGANEVHVTVNGIGERAGNAALEEVVVALHSLYNIKTNIKINELYETSKMVARLTGMYLQPNKAIVGENAFAHESGIHANGVIKKAETYEPITPEMVGHKRRFVLGKHIGRSLLKKHLERLKVKVNDKQLNEIFQRIKELGDKGKCVTDADLQAITEDVLGIPSKKIVEVQEVTVVSGNKVTPTASVKLKINGKEILESSTGVGPVDAAIKAMKKCLDYFADISLEEYHVDAITGGTDALIDVMVKLKYKDKIISARSTQPDIVMASVDAFVSGANRLLLEVYENENIRA